MRLIAICGLTPRLRLVRKFLLYAKHPPRARHYSGHCTPSRSRQGWLLLCRPGLPRDGISSIQYSGLGRTPCCRDPALRPRRRTTMGRRGDFGRLPTHRMVCEPQTVLLEGTGNGGRGWVYYTLALGASGGPGIASVRNDPAHVFVPIGEPPNLGNWARPGIIPLRISSSRHFQLRVTQTYRITRFPKGFISTTFRFNGNSRAGLSQLRRMLEARGETSSCEALQIPLWGMPLDNSGRVSRSPSRAVRLSVR